MRDHMDERAALEFCERWLPFWTGNRPEALVEVYAEDAIYRDPVSAVITSMKRSNLLLSASLIWFFFFGAVSVTFLWAECLPRNV